MELMCRTCLRMGEVQFNIFQYFQSSKLISALLMECTPIYVEAGDGLPMNMCNNCVGRLNSAFEFRTMVMQSDMKLKNITKGIEADNESQNCLKTETPDNGNEQQELGHDSASFDNTKEVHNCMSTVNYSHMQENDALYTQNMLIKQENVIDISLCNNSEQENESSYKLNSMENGLSDNYLNDSGIIENTEREEGLDENKSPEEFKLGHENLLLKPKDENLEDTFQDGEISEFKQQVGTSKGESMQEINTISEPTMKPRAYKLLNRNRCVNEREAELLENPDFKRIIEMKLSTREKGRQRVYCDQCNKTFCFQYFVTIHAPMHTGNLRFKCDKCDACFVKKPLLERHLVTTHPETNKQTSGQTKSEQVNKLKHFSCEYCGKYFAANHLLRAHISRHIGKVHKCSICEKKYHSYFLLKRHMKMHNDERDYMCDECGKTFLERRCLARHKTTHIPVPEGQSFECSVCNKKFTRRRSLVEHIKTHSTTQAPFVCNQCGKSFRYSKILKHHLFIHTGEKPYPCPYKLCNRTFRQKSAIGRHMRIHTGETPYSCELCPSTFRYKPRFLEHMKKHEGKKQQNAK